MNKLEKLRLSGIRLRITTNAINILNECDDEDIEYLINYIKKEKIEYLDKEKLNNILIKKGESVEIKNEGEIPAKDVEEDIKVKISYSSAKHKSRANVESFIELYRSRFEKIAKLLGNEREEEYLEIGGYEDLTDFNANKKVSVIGMVYKKEISKNNNIVLDLEVPSRDYNDFKIKKFVINKENKELYNLNILEDDIIKIRAKWIGNIGIVNDIVYPDINYTKPLPKIEEDFYILYISDIHFGSKYVEESLLNNILYYIKSNPEGKKIKYIVITGDNVEGVGIYPGQEKELSIIDIEKQYKKFMDFIDGFPDYVVPIFIPGNHDATIRNEPTEIILKDLVNKYKYSLPNPSYVEIHGIEHLLYHGTSLDSYINGFGLSYENGDKVVQEMLKRRHLSSINNGNPLAPLSYDFMVIEEVPNILPLGHIHKTFHTKYKGVYVINPGTFQNQTPFQKKVNLVPDIGYGYIYRSRKQDFIRIKFYK